VVYPASIAVPRRKRRAKTDRIDGEMRRQPTPAGRPCGLGVQSVASGRIDHEQGISKAGGRRLRSTMIQVSWLGLRNQPDSALSPWFTQRVQTPPHLS